MTPKTKDSKIYLVFLAVAYLILLLAAMHAGRALAEGEAGDVMTAIGIGFSWLAGPHMLDLFPLTGTSVQLIGWTTLIFALTVAYLHFDSKKREHYDSTTQAGSAAWTTDMKAYNQQYVDPVKPAPPLTDEEKERIKKEEPKNGKINPYDAKYRYVDNNMILTKDVRLSLNSRKTMRNNNVLVIGGSGAGKTRFYVKPNMLQMNASYVVTDPSGELLKSMGQPLKEAGYRIKVFNLVDMAHSNTYNPFAYIRNDTGVLSMINCLIKNTTPPNASKGDPFWEKSETALLQAIVFYLRDHEPDPSKRNFTTVMHFLHLAAIDKDGRPLDENRSDTKSQLDLLFEAVRRKDPREICVRSYDTYKMAPGRTMKSILISCGVRLTAFNLKTINHLTETDSLELSTIGDRKTALFIIISQTDSTFNFLVSMMYTQLFDALYYHAGKQASGEMLTYPVMCLLDEFANIGEIPEFQKRLSTMRKYNISASIIIQNPAQLKAMYKDDYETITGNCDTLLFLGGKGDQMLKELSEMLGKATIRTRSTSLSSGKGGGNESYSETARDLMTPDEIGTMPNDCCICQIRGLHPFYGKKYSYTDHPRYKLTGDYDHSRVFSIDNRPEYDLSRVENRMPQADDRSDARMQHEEKLNGAMGNDETRPDPALPTTDEVMRNLLNANPTSKKAYFSYHLARAEALYEKAADKMPPDYIPVFHEGPIPTGSLSYLGNNFYRHKKRECIFFANNATDIKRFSGFLCDPNGKVRERVKANAREFMSELEEADGGLLFNVERDHIRDFIRAIRTHGTSASPA